MSSIDANSPKTPIRIAAPVGAGGTNNPADVVAVEIHLNLFIAAGAVQGARPLFTVGRMTDEFKETIRKFQRQIVGLAKPDGLVKPDGPTLQFLNGPLTARGGKVVHAPGAPPADVAAARAAIVETARSLLLEGGHFLNGAMGNVPGRANGHPNRLAFARPITFFDRQHGSRLGPAVNAAWCSGRHGTLGCMGRPEAPSVKIPGNPFAAGSNTGTLIESYGKVIGKIQRIGVQVTRWPGFESYKNHQKLFDAAVTSTHFDRLLTVSTRKQFPRRLRPGGDFYLGESCTDRRHYDCIGFVNFVLSRVVSPTFQQSMEFFMEPDPRKRFEITIFRDKRDVLALAEPGDLVFKEPSQRHCGIVTMNGQRRVRVVTNCRSMKEGLIDSELTGEWNSLARLRW